MDAQQSDIPPEVALLDLLLPRFSESVRTVTGRLTATPRVTAWQIADALFALHRDDYGGVPLTPPPDRPPEERSFGEWLALVAGLYDGKRVAETTSEVIDGPLTLLGLARLDDSFGAALRASGVRQRLLRRLGFPIEQVLLPWALSLSAVDVLELQVVPPEPGAPLLSCAFSPDGAVLATAGEDGTARLWDILSGKELGTLEGHQGAVRRCEFSPDGTVLATVGGDSTARLWDVRSGSPRASLSGHEGEIRQCAFDPEGRLLATASDDGTARLWDVASGTLQATLTGHEGPLWRCTFSPDGTLLATAGEDDTARIWDVASGSERATLWGHEGDVLYCAFNPEGDMLATAGGDGAVLLWDVASGSEHRALQGHSGAVWHCAFSPDGRLLATAGADGVARLWDVETGTERAVLQGHENMVQRTAFAPGGQLLATAGGDGTARLWDVASGSERAVLRGHTGAVRRCEFGRRGRLIATASEDGTARVWEAIGPPGSLPGVAPDSPEGEDRLGIGRDAAALANVIAADATQPPLCIGLFGDWGSGKSFLIHQVQELVRDHARRARHSDRSAYCAHIRNITFNAWHYADANLWASLVTHIFDSLARPEPESGLPKEAARAQASRLHEQLAANSALIDRLQQAEVHVARVEALKGLLRWTWGLAAVKEQTRDLGQVRDDAQSTRGLLQLVLPTRRVKLIVAAVALAVAAAIAVPMIVFGASAVAAFFAAAGAWLLVAGGWIATGATRVRSLLSQVGDVARVGEVKRASLDAELDAARSREQELRQELADLAAGRRLARFAAERSEAADYRAQLGLVSRIHDDFARMSAILEDQRARHGEIKPASNGSGDGAVAADPAAAELPVVDRIVLYIDDLDRCPPRRVVEVLEAVHLILALPLFVVVVAVDPRWLLQSLRLHYAELLSAVRADTGGRQSAALPAPGRNGPTGQATDGQTASAQPDTVEAWESTPQHYLEKIFQVPFALRPVSRAGVQSLVADLLPVETGHGDGEPTSPSAAAAEPAGGAAASASAASETESRAAAEADIPIRAAPRPSLSPRSLALTRDERDFAALAAAALDTPRAVKKYTNLYRLVRAGLDPDLGELDAFLDDEGGDIPEYQAVLILLAVVSAFPDDASPFLTSIGNLDITAPQDTRSWQEVVANLRQQGAGSNELADYLDTMTETALNGASSSREPFRRWALEVSRYSFDTGQEIFAQFHTAAARVTAPGPAPVSPR